MSEAALKQDALGFRQAFTLSVASPAPGYALAVSLGVLVATASLKTPAVLILGFGLMLMSAVAGYFLNRVDPDCGTVFQWARRAVGPAGGFIGGLLVVVAGILLTGILAQTAAYYFFQLVDWHSAANSTTGLNIATVIVMVLVTVVAYLGIQLSAKTEMVLLWYQILTLLLLAIVAIVKIISGDAPQSSVDFSMAWLSPFGMGSEALVQGVLLGVFMYAGWETALTVAEETRNPRRTCGRASISALCALLVIYLFVCSALIAFAGPQFLAKFGEAGALDAVSKLVLGSSLAKLVIIAVLLSSLATAESAILAQARIVLSMSRQGALPRAFSKIHQRFLTPSTGTIFAGVSAGVWLIFFIYASETFLFDSITAAGLVYAGFYGLIALSGLVYYRHKMFTSAKAFVLTGVLPALGTAGFLAVAIKECVDLARHDPEISTYWLGVQPPLVIAAAILAVGIGTVVIGKLVGGRYFVAKTERPDAMLLRDEDEPVAAMVSVGEAPIEAVTG
ncbi:MAG: APC family permease [Actinobacteria bacterium]|nr:APC family permease [Actinomycetota bacterium]